MKRWVFTTIAICLVLLVVISEVILIQKSLLNQKNNNVSVFIETSEGNISWNKETEIATVKIFRKIEEANMNKVKISFFNGTQDYSVEKEAPLTTLNVTYEISLNGFGRPLNASINFIQETNNTLENFTQDKKNSSSPSGGGGGGGGGSSSGGGSNNLNTPTSNTLPENNTTPDINVTPTNFDVHTCKSNYNRIFLNDTSNVSCDAPLFCTFADYSMLRKGRCTDGKVGSFCSNNKDCFSTFCISNQHICKSNGSLGTGCYYNTDCSTGLVCNRVSYTCSTGAVGESCNANTDCQSNLFCNNFKKQCDNCTSCLTFPEGSLGKHMIYQISTRVAINGYNNTPFIAPGGLNWTAYGGSPTLIDNTTGWTTTTWKTFHTWGYEYTRTLIRNPNNTLKDVDLSCVSIMNDAQGKNQQSGTLITKKHLVLANHFSTQNGFNVGTKVTFMGMNNQVYVGTVAKTVQINTSDIQLYELTEDVPDYIVPCQIMSPNWSQKMPYRNADLQNPYVFFIDQRKNIVLSEMGTTPGLIGVLTAKNYSATGILWDSGSPVMALIHDRPVLLFTFTGEWAGPDYSNYTTQIQNQINAWGSSDQLDIVDLSSFIDY